MHENFNYEKTPYRAECIQWDGHNSDEVFKLLESMKHIRQAQLFRNDFILIRYAEGLTARISTLRHGDWVIKGEDGAPRFYSSERFAINYRVYSSASRPDGI